MSDDDFVMCEEHGVRRVREPLLRSDGTRIGAFTLDVCRVCDDEADADFQTFAQRINQGDFDA